ncbi:hypothetical protein, partial [Nonomuraea sp. NPDC049695]|uniref:hypothetical protein n=1 Tax=Nonomuraea sp. NPDC049695 TaxID=3154734 RepID=UPI00341D6B26
DLGPAGAFSLLYFLIVQILCYVFFTVLTRSGSGAPGASADGWCAALGAPRRRDVARWGPALVDGGSPSGAGTRWVCGRVWPMWCGRVWPMPRVVECRVGRLARVSGAPRLRRRVARDRVLVAGGGTGQWHPWVHIQP